MRKISKRYRLFLFIGISLFTMSCTGQKQTTMNNKTKDVSTGDGKYVILAPIVIKEVITQNGESNEIYIRRSMGDYFIKFCESKVSRDELEHHLSYEYEEMKAISLINDSVTLEVEFRDGYWDICDENLTQDSRTGKYVIVHRILKD